MPFSIFSTREMALSFSIGNDKTVNGDIAQHNLVSPISTNQDDIAHQVSQMQNIYPLPSPPRLWEIPVLCTRFSNYIVIFILLYKLVHLNTAPLVTYEQQWFWSCNQTHVNTRLMPLQWLSDETYCHHITCNNNVTICWNLLWQ